MEQTYFLHVMKIVLSFISLSSQTIQFNRRVMIIFYNMCLNMMVYMTLLLINSFFFIFIALSLSAFLFKEIFANAIVFIEDL
jgi:hypothetical protein